MIKKIIMPKEQSSVHIAEMRQAKMAKAVAHIEGGAAYSISEIISLL
ncbi:MAG: hypothetical protein ACLP29_08665 [Dissulfurispiraceae bacterium]|jgi:hypothetical protein